MGKRTSMRPAWTSDLGALVAAGIGVRWSCDRCGKWGDVDLDRVAAAKGEAFDLWNRQARCRETPGCQGPVRFMYRGHGRFYLMWD